MLISLMDGSLVWSNQHHQSGTLMPSGAVHTIIARSASDEAIHPLACLLMDCFACARNDVEKLPLHHLANMVKWRFVEIVGARKFQYAEQRLQRSRERPHHG